jgi:hypothetical protein
MFDNRARALRHRSSFVKRNFTHRTGAATCDLSTESTVKTPPDAINYTQFTNVSNSPSLDSQRAHLLPTSFPSMAGPDPLTEASQQYESCSGQPCAIAVAGNRATTREDRIMVTFMIFGVMSCREV